MLNQEVVYRGSHEFTGFYVSGLEASGLGLWGTRVSGLGKGVQQLVPSCGGTHLRILGFGT